MNSIKIFVTQSQCLDKLQFVKNDILIPVLGGAIYKKNIGQIQGDEEGINISSQNDIYCELTTQYWAWKNLNLKYYGFCHYRRFFSFNQKRLDCDSWNVVNCSYANQETIKKLYLDQIELMKKVIKNYDIIVPDIVELKKVGYNSVYEQFAKTSFMKSEVLDLTIQIIRESFPEYYDSAKKYIYGEYFYPYNMFIMKKKFFDKYCEWLFEILQILISKLDMSNYSIQNRRIPAHIGERLLGVYLTYIKDANPMVNIKELQVGFIHNLAPIEEIKPVLKDSIPIVMAANEFFIPMLSAALCSLIENSDQKTNYDIVLLESGILPKTKSRLLSLCNNKTNISLRFYNVSSIIDNYNLYVSNLITVETYYRFLIPELFKNYSKVLYLDGDIVVKHNVAELYDISIDDYLIGACHDVTCSGLVNGFDETAFQYCKEKMKLKNPLNQFNAGVMIMNLEKFRSKYTTDFMLKFAETGNFKFWDQDALNILCEDSVKWIDSSWNFFCDEKNGWRGTINQYAPKNQFDLYLKAGENPYIFHFAGNEKPWFDPSYEYAEEFWYYLRKTPFYEIMLQRRMIDTSCYFIDQRSGEKVEPLHNFAKRILIAIFPATTFRGKFAHKIFKYMNYN